MSDLDIKELKAIAIQRNDLVAYIQRDGRKVVKKGKEQACECYFHSDSNPSMMINEAKGMYHCFSCGAGGNVIDLHMHIKGMTFIDATKELADVREPVVKKATGKPRTITYSYNDAYGNLVFNVDRIEDGKGGKTFRQYHMVDGKRVNSMDGVTRVLYRLDKIVDKEQVFITEGEKGVAALVRLGYDATTNCGGSNGWYDAYAESLRDKDVVIMPDNDEPGAKWHTAVLESLKGKARSIQTLKMPPPYNDIGDVYEEKGDDACDLIMDLQDQSAVVKRGADVPIYTFDELMEIHRKAVTAEHRVMLDFGHWLPTLRQYSRPLVPGDMYCVMAPTGVGKSAAMQNIGLAVPDLTTLMFQLELAEETMAERWAAIATGIGADTIEKNVQRGEVYSTHKLPQTKNTFTCTLSGITVDRIEEIIEQAELKIGKRPDHIMVDYVGLVAGKGVRYEKTSNTLEQLKVVAKRQRVIMGVCSQISRKQKDDDDIEVHISDGKDSGSIENSCQFVLGMWRPTKETCMVRILKDTRGGGAGRDAIPCSHSGASLQIRETPNYQG